LSDEEKCLITLTPGANIIKHFLFVNDARGNLEGLLVHDLLVQSSLTKMVRPEAFPFLFLLANIGLALKTRHVQTVLSPPLKLVLPSVSFFCCSLSDEEKSLITLTTG
jgi:hypothetical protein